MVIRIGTSGWSYDHWHPELYPPGLPVGDRLARYAAAFGTAELNSSFYRWPQPAAFRSWRDRLPDGLDDLVAVLQKEIRRSRIDNAVLAAYEMFTTSADVAQHLWRRLRLIAVADVGMGLRVGGAWQQRLRLA